MQVLCDQATSTYCILSVPLLIENGLDAMVNRTLVVDIDESTQLQRAIQRDASSESTIKNIMAAQATREQRLEKADDLIRNDQDLEWLKQQVNTLHEKYMHVSLLQRFS
jgi:dephospho-CoA kinase